MHLFRMTVCSAMVLLVGCGGGTTRHLLSVGDSARTAPAGVALDANWFALDYGDTAWSAKATAFNADVTAMPADVTTRSSFDIGADYAAFKELTLTFAPGAPYDVYVNGVALGHGDGKSTPVALHPADGLLRASGNVLGLCVHAAAMGAMNISPTLDGTADATALKSGAPSVVRGPWLLSPRADGVTIVWETNVATASRVVVDGQTIDGGGGTHHVAQVGGLTAGSNYHYHVEVGTNAGEEQSFTTAPADKSARLRFIVYGDNRTDGDAHRRVVDAMRTEGADFIINTGDLVNSSSDDEWQTFFDIEYSLLATTPMYPSLGNHEENSGGAGRFAELFPLGKPDLFKGRVYSFDYGAVHVAVLDSNMNLADQQSWLDSDLSAATAAGAKHLFVALHWGPYSGRSYLQHGSNMDARLYVVPIAKKHHVDAILAGHDHYYERGDAGDELSYFVSGGGGAPLVDTGHIAETREARSTHHYIVFDVAGPDVHAVAKDDTGTTFDQVDILRGNPPPS